METLNTLRYANRAKNIKNKVTANQDKSSQTITALRREIQQLQIELQEYQQGKRLIDSDGTEKINDMFHENMMLMSEVNNLKTRVKALQETNERLTSRNAELLVERESGHWIDSIGSGDKSDVSALVHGYMKEIEELRTKLMEMEETCSILRKQTQRNYSQRLSLSPYQCGAVAMTGHYDIGPEELSTHEVIAEAKKDVEKMKKLTKLRKKVIRRDSNPDTNGNDIEMSEQIINLNGENDEQEESEGDSEELSNSDVSDDEQQEAQNAINAESALLDLISEISLKEKLIIELERSQKRMSSMRQHYEEKLLQLQNKISETESERDNVLAKLSNVGNQSDDSAKKVREDYQKKLNSLQTEMKKLQAAKREHSQAMRTQIANENQMRQLRNEVMEMKKQKVKLLSKMKEETQKHREAEMKNNKKISQLAKQDRQKAIKIRTLEVESNRVKNLLRRKDEEINAIKKRAKPMSDRVAGRVINGNVRSSRRPLPFSPIAAKQKWQKLEQDINKIVLSKQNISVHEKAMERYIQQRQQLSRALDKANKKYESAISEGNSESVIRELQEEIELIEANLKYLNENIDDIQSSIVQIEDAKDGDFVDTSNIISYLQMDEIKYLFDKVLAMAISQSMLATQKEEEKRDIELKYKQVADSSLIQEQLLQHVLDTTFLNEPIIQPSDEYQIKPETEITNSSHQLPFIVDNHFAVPLTPQIHTQSTDSCTKSEKARRLTKTPQELLFETSMTADNKNRNSNDVMTQSLMAPILLNNDSDLHRIPSAPSLK
jgi:kinesin family protein 4/21/27